MDVATGAMGSLPPKMLELLKDEYKLQANLKKDVKFLESEMRGMDAALRKVAKVPRDQLDEEVKIWADEVRELSYEMEDLVDGFLVRVEGSEPAADPGIFMGLMKMMTNLFKEGKDLLFNKGKDLFNKGRDRHQIAHAIKDIKDQVQEVAARRKRYKVDDVRANSAAATTVYPRMLALFKDQRELVGIEGPRDELIKRLTDGDDGGVSSSDSEQQLKVLSIFGFGGLGKTTLAKAVYERLQSKFDRKAFVPVGQNPDGKKVLRDILFELDEASCSSAAMLDETQLIGKLRGLLEDKRYLIVIDDVWNQSSWKIIECALIDSRCGSRIILTTRILEVAEVANYVYKQEPLSPGRSKELFHKRLSVGRCENSRDQLVEMSKKILQKCGGVPLAIITIASLLVNKPRDDWSKVYASIGFGHGDNEQVNNTRKILRYSCYDLPCYLRTCLLHLSIFPEDYEIPKNTLIWKWIGEGFVLEEPGKRLFEVGEGYFNELINRSMIQPVETPYEGTVYGCRVHDLVLDMLYTLAKEEKFVLVLGSNEQHTSSQSITNARRLAIQRRATDDEEQDIHLANTNMQKMRSFNAIECHLIARPFLSSFQVLRVLALEGRKLGWFSATYCSDQFEHLGKLLQLRYLGLSNTPITELPEEIGKLKFLQTLDFSNTKIKELPRSVGLLSQLKCPRLPELFIGPFNWIGKLTSLEELSLPVVSSNDSRQLCWHQIKQLCVFLGNAGNANVGFTNCGDYVPSRHLRYLDLSGACFARLPAWIDSSCVPHLSQLILTVKAMEAQDVEILGKFPELTSLTLLTSEFPDVVAGGDALIFPKLRRFCTNGKVRFLQGAMPSLEFVEYYVWREAGSLEHEFASLGNLPCLQKVKVYMRCTSAAVKEKAEAALRHAIQIHPNGPTLEFDPHVAGGKASSSSEETQKLS